MADARHDRRSGGPTDRAWILCAQDLADGLASVRDAWFLEIAYLPSEAERTRLASRDVLSAPDSMCIDGHDIAVRRHTAHLLAAGAAAVAMLAAP